MAEFLGGNCAGESSVVALQEKPFVLKAGANHSTVFGAVYKSDHSSASSTHDLSSLNELFKEFESENQPRGFEKSRVPTKNIFDHAPFLEVQDLTDSEINQYFGQEKRFAEMEHGQLLSFFCRQKSGGRIIS